jgi:hypothetical protein
MSEASTEASQQSPERIVSAWALIARRSMMLWVNIGQERSRRGRIDL